MNKARDWLAGGFRLAVFVWLACWVFAMDVARYVRGWLSRHARRRHRFAVLRVTSRTDMVAFPGGHLLSKGTQDVVVWKDDVGTILRWIGHFGPAEEGRVYEGVPWQPIEWLTVLRTEKQPWA